MSPSAGIFDGEGWAIIAPYNSNSTFDRKVYPRHRIRIGVSNTLRPMLEWLKRTWGGNLYRVYARQGKRRALYCWQPSEKIAAQFLSRILPCLNTKKPQANLALEFRWKTIFPAFTHKPASITRQWAFGSTLSGVSVSSIVGCRHLFRWLSR